MPAQRSLIKPTMTLLAIGAVALFILLLPSRGVSISWGDGEWVYSSYAGGYDSLCAQNDPNRRCKEWCEFNTAGQLQGTGELCCVKADGICHLSNIFYP